jgi:hypothetical protein
MQLAHDEEFLTLGGTAQICLISVIFILLMLLQQHCQFSVTSKGNSYAEIIEAKRSSNSPKFP